MSTFVLVHGFDGSAWQAVVDHLEEVAPRLLPRSPDMAKVNKNVNHAQCTIDRRLHCGQRLDIVLLGHSFGGTIIAKASDRQLH